MHIDKTTGSTFINAYQKQANVSPVEKAKPIQQEDQVQISNRAKEMYEKKTEASTERQEKINQLKAQIESGEYQVNGKEVADKVFQFWFDK